MLINYSLLWSARSGVKQNKKMAPWGWSQKQVSLRTLSRQNAQKRLACLKPGTNKLFWFPWTVSPFITIVQGPVLWATSFCNLSLLSLISAVKTRGHTNIALTLLTQGFTWMFSHERGGVGSICSVTTIDKCNGSRADNFTTIKLHYEIWRG